MKRIAAFLLLVLGSSICHARVIAVTASQSISKVIEKAAAGDTILIKSGHYKPGHIEIKKKLILIGENWPVLDGENKFEIITVSAENVVITGLHLMNTGVASIDDLAAIKGNGANRIQIINNQIDHAFFGIHLSNTANAIVRQNQIAGGHTEEETMLGNGIHLWKCSQAQIESNTISGHRDGIYFEFVTQSQIRKNFSERNIRYGLHFMFSNDDGYYENHFISNGAGVAVMYTHHVTMIGNYFEKNWGGSAYGLLLKDITDSHVEKNYFVKNTIALHMEGTSRITFEKNSFIENGYAVRLQASCDANTFSHNNFSKNTFDIATNGSLVLNSFDQNYWDHYNGYDLKKDGIGDVPFRPVSLYSMVVERVPSAVFLWRSFIVFLLDQSEKTLPLITPENLKDSHPLMKPYDIR
jgi:nitrous oxidase accessory protein